MIFSQIIWFFTILILSISPKVSSENSELLSVVVIYRHGDRSPSTTYPNDPYGNDSFWPVDFGQLTNIGKNQQFDLGKWFRTRYDGFLPRKYSENDIYIRSTDVDRTIMSAAANLAGLYPPERDQVWNPKIPWQPIPIHTVPVEDDHLVYAFKDCKKYNVLYEKMMNSEEIRKINEDNKELYEYLSENSGLNITTFQDVKYLYNVLYIQDFYNYTLPTWTDVIFPDKIKPLAELNFKFPTYTPEMAKLRIGPLFHQILEHFNAFNNSKANPKTSWERKFIMLSAHDYTTSDLMNSMGIFDLQWPPYATTVIFEMYQNQNSTKFINVLYKNTTHEAIPMKLPECAFNCNFDDFSEIIKPLGMTIEEQKNECT